MRIIAPSILSADFANLAKDIAMVKKALSEFIEKGGFLPNLATLRTICDALYCDLIVLPAPRKRVADIIAEKTMGVPHRRMWD